MKITIEVKRKEAIILSSLLLLTISIGFIYSTVQSVHAQQGVAAIVGSIATVNSNSTHMLIEFYVFYSGSNVPGGFDTSTAVVAYAPGDTVNTFQARLSDAVTNDANNNPAHISYGLLKQDIVLQGWSKG